MAKIPVEVTFETITPLWTGDAWGENEEVKPSSILGALRFWFAFYWKVVKDEKTEPLNDIGVPHEVLTELENPSEEKTFKKLFKKYLLEDGLEYDEAIDKTLETLGLSVPSRIFGCTGWKGRLQLDIADYYIKKISLSEIDTNYLINGKFWIKKVLFHDRNSIKVFENIKLILKVPKYWWNNYLKDFFEFYKDKIILIGGKKAFGLGFINISLQPNQHFKQFPNFNSYGNSLIIKEVPISYKGKKEVLGYNFRYFLRRHTKRQFRENNFGKQGKASKIYISNLLRSQRDNPFIFMVVLNSPFKDFKDKEIPFNLIKYYINLLKSQNEE